jgi:hypothetical protein
MISALARPLACALARSLACALALSALPADAAQGAADDPEIRAYANDTCIVADEPYLLPAPQAGDAADQSTTRFFPLVGLVVGKLTEMFINHVASSSAGQIKATATRKDTRYAVIRQMNLYRADFQPEPVVHLNARLGCMTIVAARFKPDSTDCTAAYVPKQLTRETMRLPETEWRSSRQDDSIENQLRRADVCVEGKARAVYEARFEFSEDGTAYRLKSAGYRIDTLLTTRDTAASRTAFYTLEISQPDKSDQHETLSTAWVRLGTVRAGAHADGAVSDSPPWLKVPPLSTEARRIYEEKTRVHQQVMGEIEALKRALTRDQRLLAGLDQRIAQASGDVAAGLSQERTRVAVQMQTRQAELDASDAEYQDLPRTPMEFMPVTIVVAVTESESEKTGMLELASIIEGSGAQLASAASSASAGHFSKSLEVTDSSGQRASADELASAQARYFDALVEVKTGAPGVTAEDAERHLAAARMTYNEARRALGLELIE